MRFLCDCCKNIVEPVTMYDAAPNGDDYDKCPVCGQTDCFGLAKWIRHPDLQTGPYTVHEVQCPSCKYKETYIKTAPKKCYICGLDLEV